ncbi:MAG: two-component regulator propeller domain-containing protein [Sediminicola sp.]
MKDNHILGVFGVFMFLVSLTVRSQAPEEDYNFVTIERISTQRAIASIAQDQMGLIWMGTNGAGLNKFNGVSLTSYKQDNDIRGSLNSSLIRNTYVDSANRLWAGTEMGLNVYNRNLDSFDEVTFHLDSGVMTKISIRAIVEIKEGELLVGSHFYGLFKVDIKTMEGHPIRIQTRRPLSNFQINSLVKDKKGKIFIGSNLGLFQYENGEAVPVLSSYGSEGAKQIGHHIESMAIDDDGSLWLGTFSEGLTKVGSTPFSTYFVQNFKITDQRILALAQAPDGRILCGTENDGLFLLSKNGKVVKSYRYDKFGDCTIKSNSIWSLFVDNEDRIWIGYYNKGVGVYDKFHSKFKSIKSLPNVQNSLQSPSVTGILSDDDGKLWIGIDGGGVDVYDPIKNKFHHLIDPKNTLVSGLDNPDVVAMFMDSGKNIWVGTWNGGIFYLPKGGESFVQYHKGNTNGGLRSNRIMAFAEDSKGTIWIGTFLNGLHSYDPDGNIFTHRDDAFFKRYKLSQNDIHKLLVDSDDNIWIGTTLGLYKAIHTDEGDYNVVSLASQMYQEADYIVHDIVSMFEDKDRNVWIGTDGAGVCKYSHADKEYEWVNHITGLEHETVSSILQANDGDMWFAGNKGLTRYDIVQGTFTHFDTNDGLLANDFNFNSVFKDSQGILYFGSYGGINYLDPDNIIINKNKPQLYFSDFKLFNRSVQPGTAKSPLKKIISQTSDLTLTHRQSVFTIEYTGINYTKPEKTQYAYYLEGFEDTWNYVGNVRNATYTNLSPGDYTFKVKASNNDGVWNEEPLTLELTVLPPWWNSNMAWLSYVLGTVLLTYFVVKLVKQRVQEKRLVKFELDRRLQEEVLNDRKIQFFTNISHEFRTPLTLILNPLEDIIEHTGIYLPQRVKEKHAIIHKNAKRLKRLMDELMDFRKLQLNKFSINVSQIDPLLFVREITSHFEEEATLKNILLTVESDDVPFNLWSDPGMLEKVIFNILSNAFKITPDNGMISVGIYRCKNQMIFPLIDDDKVFSAMEISIEDTGTGISKEEVKNVFERFYQVKKMNSQYYGGTGIGLEVVKSFIDLLKGQVVVESEESVGTKFRIFLPLGHAHFRPDELFLAPIPDPRYSEVQHHPCETELNVMETGAKKTLLIVEDNTELRSYIKSELENEYAILEAANGSEGLAIAVKRIPDLIITDVVMPEMNGFEFCSRVKEDLKISHIPVLMLTAKAMTDDWVRGIDSGADVYLSKPFEMKVLRAQLKQLVTSRQLLFNKYFQDTKNVKIPDNTSPLDKKFITKVLEYINNNLSDENMNVEQLADELSLSRSQLYRKIKALTGFTANEFLRKIRLEKAREMIEDGHESISEVSFKVGFSSPSYFTKCFKLYFGVLPTELKQE